jgi:signal transduction histidine kinase
MRKDGRRASYLAAWPSGIVAGAARRYAGNNGRLFETHHAMRWSIRYQLLVPLLTLLVGVAGMSTWTALASAGRARRQIETQVHRIVHTVNKSTYPLKENVLLQMKELSGADYLLVDSDGHRWTTLPSADVSLPAPDPEAADGRTVHLDRRVTIGETSYLFSGVSLAQRHNAGATLYIFYPESLWQDALWEAIRPSLILGAFGGLASVALAVGVAQRLSRRIQELERRTRLIAAGDFSPMPLPGRDDELRDLGRSVNDMAERLAQYRATVGRTERLRLLGQVSGGLAHQLRNGVAGARLAVQLHVRECNGHTDPEALSVALRQLALVEVHLKRFLDLGGSTELRRESCALTAVLDEAVALLRPQCRHAGIDLRWQAPPPGPMLFADAGQLGHLFVNVIGNAVEAAGPGGWVQVELQMADGRWQMAGGRSAIVTVADSGPGPSSEVTERLFEPFVTGKADGVGLGLAVARQVADAHGGSIRWRREADRTCFMIDLPLESRVLSREGEAPAEPVVSARQEPRPPGSGHDPLEPGA